MKVLLQLRKFSGGPFIFRERLNKALQRESDLQIVNSIKQPFDVELSFIRHLGDHAKPKIIRVDGCYYKPGQVKANRELRSAIKTSKMAIFQSEFSKTMIEKVLGVKSKSEIIYNGIDLHFLSSIHAEPSIEPGSFVAAAGWRPNKRPNSMIKGFLEANTGKNLYVIGRPDEINKSLRREPKIKIMGQCSEPKTISIMKACDYMLHLCHIDSCPNAVVEGLSSGCNVLCTNLGGTKELVRKDGVVLDIDRWDFKPNPFANVDRVNPKTIAKGIGELMKIKTKPNRPEFCINSVAKQYADVIRSFR